MSFASGVPSKRIASISTAMLRIAAADSVENGSSSGPVARLRSRLRRAQPTIPRRSTFRNPAKQEVFERDGFVVVDLLDESEVLELRRRYDLLDHVQRDRWDWVDGFETSLYDDRPEYRRTVRDDAEAVVSEPLDHLLDRYRLMFANWVVKLPGAAEVPLHADWTFLDEGSFSSVTVWCPLVDTSVPLANGPLGVVVGSQRHIDFLRVANVPCYDRCVDAVSHLDRVVPSLRAGQAIVLDNRVVHFSPANETATTRVALGCVLGPIEADLHHYWMDGQDRLQRFDLDRSFYLDYAIGRPLDATGILAMTEVEPAPTS
jgi:hypothetical protein